MEFKICTKCNKNKPIEEFAWRSKPNNKRHAECKVCHRKVRKAYYEKSGEKDKIIARNYERRRKTREWLQQYKQELRCNRCGYDKAIALQFHHTDPNSKEYCIAEAVHRAWSVKRLQVEIDKCEVLCANCHIEEHHGDKY